MAFGGGVLISAVAFDLVQEAVDTQTAQWPVLLGICAGCATFFGGEADRPRRRRQPEGPGRRPGERCRDARRHDDARAHEHGGRLVGIFTTLGFTVALGIQQLD